MGSRRRRLPSWLVPPALRPDGEQGLGQPLQAQARQSRSHGEPHVTGPGLTRRPGCPEHQLGLLQGAVEQTHLVGTGRARVCPAGQRGAQQWPTPRPRRSDPSLIFPPRFRIIWDVRLPSQLLSCATNTPTRRRQRGRRADADVAHSAEQMEGRSACRPCRRAVPVSHRRQQAAKFRPLCAASVRLLRLKVVAPHAPGKTHSACQRAALEDCRPRPPKTTAICPISHHQSHTKALIFSPDTASVH